MEQKMILVVEDNPAMAEGICDVLEMEGYAVATAGDGVEALARLEESSIDLILADIMMPLMDGHEFYEKVRQRSEWTTIPFVFLTAKGQKEDIRIGKQLGADDYLVKPFDPEDLAVVVKSRLRRAKEVQQASEEQFDTLKKSILNALSHEFRTPLTYIQGYTELLLEGDPATESEVFKDFLERIQAGSDRIHALVEDFILLVSLESGESAQAISQGGLATDLMPIIRAVTSASKAKMDQKGITLHTDWSPALPPVFAYAPMIDNALGRLLDNAIKFCFKEDGHIWVSTKAEKRQVRIVVRDNGCGIPPEEQIRIFERFYQVDRDLYEQQGVGLGLSIAQGIIALHNGTIKVESTPGEGSTFTIVLPMVG